MERKIAKLLAFTGVAVSAAVALTPLTSYAAVNPHGYNCDPSKATTTGTANLTTGGCAGATTGSKKVAITVESNISIDAVSGMSINMTPHVLGTGEISATVTSTHPYTISLSSSQPNLTNPDNGAQNIPAKSSFTKDDNGWGIKKSGASDYTALTGVPTVYYTGANPATKATTKFEVGVAVNEQTAPGTYKTDVTVTAATQI
jgi:hypothetical protein